MLNYAVTPEPQERKVTLTSSLMTFSPGSLIRQVRDREGIAEHKWPVRERSEIFQKCWQLNILSIGNEKKLFDTPFLILRLKETIQLIRYLALPVQYCTLQIL